MLRRSHAWSLQGVGGTRQRAGIWVLLLPTVLFLIIPLKQISNAVPPGPDVFVTIVCSVEQLGCAGHLASPCSVLPKLALILHKPLPVVCLEHLAHTL